MLLSLRGAPNITLGLHVAKALAGSSSITIYHAADRERTGPDLEALMRADPQIQRAVTAVSGITEGVLKEAQNHKSIVLGARLHSELRSSTSGPVVQQIAAQTEIPLVLVRASVRSPSISYPAPAARPNRRHRSTMSTAGSQKTRSIPTSLLTYGILWR